MLASAQRQREIDGAQIEPAGNGFLRRVLPGSPTRAFAVMKAMQVADVHHALGIIERLVVDHEPRMCRALEQAHQFAELNVALDRDDVGPMHHDVGDAALVQGEDIAQHGALDPPRSRPRPASRRRAPPADRRVPIRPSSRTGYGSRAAASCRRQAAGLRLPAPPTGRLRGLAAPASLPCDCPDGRNPAFQFTRSRFPHRDRECRVARGPRASRASIASASSLFSWS